MSDKSDQNLVKIFLEITLGLIGMGNEAASTALVKLLGSTKNERIRSLTVESLEKIGMNNKEASMALLELLGSTKNNLTRLL
ncbi:MAG: HEAT repeat domain-containing protein [Xenococcus sp. MO_188.B8]|nr:HEAT repeat domain-containing protein [Xenococcus sp. MO_188.B8]